MQAGCETRPLNLSGTGTQAFCHPDVPIEGDQGQATILEEIDSGRPNGPPVGIFQRKGNWLESKNAALLCPGEGNTDAILPPAIIGSDGTGRLR